MHETNLGRDAELAVHLHHIWPVVKCANDVSRSDAGVFEQSVQLLLLEFNAVAVVFHVAHQKHLVSDAMTLEPFDRDGLVHDGSGGEDDDVVARVDVQLVVVRHVEAAQRVVVVVAPDRVVGLPVDARDAPAVVGDAIVNVKNDNAHVSPRFQIYIQIRGVLLPIRTIELSRVFGGSRTPTCPTPLCLLL